MTGIQNKVPTFDSLKHAEIMIILDRHILPAEINRDLLQQKPDIFQQILKRYIAYYLGLAPETLSRLIKS